MCAHMVLYSLLFVLIQVRESVLPTKMDHFELIPIESFEYDHLPTKFEVLCRILSVKSQSTTLPLSKIFESVAQQVIQIWRLQQLKPLALKNVIYKITPIFRRWEKIEKQKRYDHKGIRKLRQTLHDDFNEIFDVPFGGLTTIKDEETRRFYIDSCALERKGGEPLRRQPSVEIVDETSDRSSISESEPLLSISSQDNVRTRSSNEPFFKLTRASVEESKNMPSGSLPNLESLEDEPQAANTKPTFAQLCQDHHKKRVHDTRSKHASKTHKEKKKKFFKQTEKGRIVSIMNRFNKFVKPFETESASVTECEDDETEDDVAPSPKGRTKGYLLKEISQLPSSSQETASASFFSSQETVTASQSFKTDDESWSPEKTESRKN